jgi:hypothetical protein
LWHQWQMGSFSSTMRRLCMNSGLFRLVIVFLCCGYVTSALGLCPAVAFVCVMGSDVCAPHISQLCAVGCRNCLGWNTNRLLCS